MVTRGPAPGDVNAQVRAASEHCSEIIVSAGMECGWKAPSGKVRFARFLSAL